MSGRIFRRVVVVIGCLLVWTVRAEAQETARPRIGLVLSGGGARGIAHIGVLQWMEEHQIPVDRVVGTSMGALVGGFYATGLSPREMLTIVESADWTQALSGRAAYSDLSFRRKQDRRAFPSDIEFGLRHGQLQARSGLNSGHDIQLIFNRVTLPYTNDVNFDDLPIPFRCVATDMTAAQPVILQSGSLSSAMRASMAIPGVFTLVKRDGLLLADGGLMNNIPTDVARQNGADVVIAVNVSPAPDKNSVGTFPGLLQQSVNVMTIEGQRRNLGLADVVVTPELGGFDIFDFERSLQLVKRGYESAEKNSQALMRYSLSEDDWKRYLAARSSRRRTKIPVPSFVVVTGAGKSNRFLRRTLQKFTGKRLDTTILEQSLNQLRGQSGYDSVGYELTRRAKEPDRLGLLVNVQEKPFGPPFFYPAFLLEGGSSLDRNDVTFLSRVVTPHPNANGAETRVDVALGSSQQAAGEYYQPLQKGAPPFVAARVSLDQNTQDLFSNDFRIAQYRVERLGAALDAGYTFARSEIRASYEVARYRVAVRVGDPTLPTLNSNEQSAVVRYTFDSEDSATIPSRGTYLQSRAGYYFGTADTLAPFFQAEAQATSFLPVGKKDSVFFHAAMGTSFESRISVLEQFTLGGPFRLAAFNRNEFRAERYLLTGVGYLRALGQLPTLLGRKIYMSSFVEHGGFSLDGQTRSRNSASLGLAADTVIGPIALGAGYGDGNRRALYFSVGRIF